MNHKPNHYNEAAFKVTRLLESKLILIDINILCLLYLEKDSDVSEMCNEIIFSSYSDIGTIGKTLLKNGIDPVLRLRYDFHINEQCQANEKSCVRILNENETVLKKQTLYSRQLVTSDAVLHIGGLTESLNRAVLSDVLLLEKIKKFLKDVRYRE